MTRETQGTSWMKITRNLMMMIVMMMVILIIVMMINCKKKSTKNIKSHVPKEADKVEVDEPSSGFVDGHQPVGKYGNTELTAIASCK